MAWIWSFLLWCMVAIICFAIVRWGPPFFKRVSELLLPMWLPLLVIIVAGVALFGTDQGRDLGVGLLGNGQFQLFLLALALFYWATGSWHVARLGLNRRFGTVRANWPPDYEPWLRWLPRLIGACAHFFAAFSLAFAARHVIDPEEMLVGPFPLWPVAFVPPAVIAIGTLVLWHHDRRYIAARDAAAALQAVGDAHPGRVQAACDARTRAVARLRRAVGELIGSALVIVGLLLGFGDRLPQGLAHATLWVLASAVAFLLIVSLRRSIGERSVHRSPARLADWLRQVFQETDQKWAQSSAVLALALSAVAFSVGAWAWWHPVGLGAFAGSMVVGFFAFGAYIAIIDLVRLFSGTRFAAVCAFLLLLAAGTSATRDFHRVRLCGDARTPCPTAAGGVTAGSPTAGAWVDDRPSIEEAARAWYAQARKTWPEEQPVPMLIIATAGGGIRAAYWTATVLEQLERDLGPELMRRHLFAISGVSGGSVGAAAYVAAMAKEPLAPRPTRLLDHDFLAPALAAMAFVDGPSSLLPDFGQGDRGYALERTWEVASSEVLARPFLSFFPTRRELKDGADWRPALLLNATHQDTGKRVITSHLTAERHVFLDSFDAHDLLKSDMPASTAAHNSARFSYISPAGKLVPRGLDGRDAGQLGFILDGGYFENFGAVTALQLAREAQRAIGPEKVRLAILQISSDPSLTARDRPRLHQDVSLCDASPKGGFLPFQYSAWEGLRWRRRDDGGLLSSFLNEVMAPIAGVLASRDAHGTLASQELAYAVCAERRAPAAEGPHRLNSAPTSAEHPVQRPVVTASDKGAPLTQPDHRPEFAHLAMCDEEGATVPPLGWVLSPSMRAKFTRILHEECANAAELERLSRSYPLSRGASD